MKPLIALMLAFCALHVSVAQAQGAPRLLKAFVADSETHHMGQIDEHGGSVTHIFQLTNKTDQRLQITEVSTGCGCTTVAYSQEAILPGHTAEITVSYNPLGRPGKFAKDIMVILNDGKYYTQLHITGEVILSEKQARQYDMHHLGHGVYSDRRELVFSPLATGKSMTLRFYLINTGNREVTVTLQKKPLNRVLKLTEKVVLPPGSSKEVTAQYVFTRQRTQDAHLWIQTHIDRSMGKPIKVRFPAYRKQRINKTK